ncbi:uncharacterized protein LOC123896601 [Trifolium pratense]|uniref:uncharacterized protein LOC123896601 n=1 Tax=Trifolium pratense TaxID=57577 RepID=UPI001E69387F|nr:uncharacterized protein LOC123896601 [Trifolium pratense]
MVPTYQYGTLHGLGMSLIPIITTPTTQTLLMQRVHALIDMQQGVWNEAVIRSNFNVRDVEEILKIPLVSMARKDDIIWRFDKKGLYSVKSAYRVCVDVLINRDERKVEGDWNKLWNRPIPPKVKHFMWRLGRNSLEKLMDFAESFHEVFIRLWKELNSSQLINFAMTSWSIWKMRNLKLWENKDE